MQVTVEGCLKCGPGAIYCPWTDSVQPLTPNQDRNFEAPVQLFDADGYFSKNFDQSKII